MLASKDGEVPVTPERAVQRVRQLLALAAPSSGAPENERRNAALAAAATVESHGLVVSPPGTSAVDLDEVVNLALRVMQLERLLAVERASRDADLRRRDEHWQSVVEVTRRRGKEAAKAAVARATTKERKEQARAGGRARRQTLTPERRAEIARAAAAARWACPASGLEDVHSDQKENRRRST